MTLNKFGSPLPAERSVPERVDNVDMYWTRFRGNARLEAIRGRIDAIEEDNKRIGETWKSVEAAVAAIEWKGVKSAEEIKKSIDELQARMNSIEAEFRALDAKQPPPAVSAQETPSDQPVA